MNRPEHGYDVGHRRAKKQEEGKRFGYCDCCELPYVPRPRDRFRDHCNDCASHYPIYGEDAERREMRLTSHVTQVRTMYEEMRVLLNRNEVALRNSREAVSSALRSRDSWKRKVDRIQALHFPRPDGSCTCGEKRCKVMELVGETDAHVRGYDD